MPSASSSAARFTRGRPFRSLFFSRGFARGRLFRGGLFFTGCSAQTLYSSWLIARLRASGRALIRQALPIVGVFILIVVFEILDFEAIEDGEDLRFDT